MKKSFPLVSVIIVNYNGKKYLPNCIKSLLTQDYPKDRLEIIVIDNNSTDGSVSLLRTKFPKVKLFKSEVNNYCIANNIGINKAKGEYIALLNNDTEIDKGWLKELIKVAVSDKRVGALSCKILFMDGKIQSTGHQEFPNFYWGDRGFKEADKGQYNKIEEVPSICGGAALYSKKCLEDIGLLDKDFVMYLDDVDMAIRCRKKGWKLVYVPKSVVHHVYQGSGSQELMNYYIERNRLLILAKYYPESLAKSFFGKGYFVNNNHKLLEVLPMVIDKLIKNSNPSDILRRLSALFKEIERLKIYEKDTSLKELGQAQKLIYDRDRDIESITKEKNDIVKLKDKLLSEKDALLKEKDSLIRQKDKDYSLNIAKLSKEKEALLKSINQKYAIKGDRIMKEKDILLKAKDDDLAKRVTELIKELDVKLNKDAGFLIEKDKELAIKNSMIIEKDKELTYERKISEYELAKKEGRIKELLMEISALKNQNDILSAVNDEIIIDKNKSIFEKDKELSLKDLAIRDRDIQIRNKDSVIIYKDNEILEKDDHIKYCEFKINELQNQINEKNLELNSLSNELIFNNERNSLLIAEKDKEIALKNDEVSCLDKINLELNEKIDALNNNLNLVQRELFKLQSLRYIKQVYYPFCRSNLFIREKLNKWRTDLNAVENSITTALVAFKDKTVKFKETIKNSKIFIKFYDSNNPISKLLQAIYRTRNKWLDIYFKHIKVGGQPPTPETLILMLTKRCNLKCDFCNIKNLNDEMKTDDAIKIIDNVYRLGIKTLVITGGEPFLHRDIFRIVKHAKDIGLFVCITTNGLQILELIDKIIESCIDTLSISMDGLGEAHDDMRNYSGIFDKVCKGIEELQLRSSNIALNFVITKKNLKEIEKVYSWAKERDIFFDFWPVNYCKDLYINIDGDYKTLAKFIRRLRNNAEIRRSKYHYFLKLPLYLNNNIRLKVRCLGLSRHFGVDVDGNVMPCCVWGKEHINLGNAIKDDMVLLWNSRKYRQVRQDIFYKGCSTGCYNHSLHEFMCITGKDFIISSKKIKIRDDKLSS